MKKMLILALIPILASCLGISKEDYCEKAWRFDLECALNYTLSEKEIAKISNLAEKLNGRDCAKTAWNILEWTEENIRYNDSKASLPAPKITIKGREVIVDNPWRVYQTPEETLMLRSGICGDYAILITALLLKNNCKAYIAYVNFKNSEIDHLASLVLLDRFYVLDQKLPPIDLASYYRKWLRDGKEVESLEIYERDRRIMNLTAEDMLSQDYEFKKEDLRRIEFLLTEKLKKSFVQDEIAVYREKFILRMSFEGLADLYSPVFAEEFAEMIYKKVMERIKGKWSRFKLEIQLQWPDIILNLSLAN